MSQFSDLIADSLYDPAFFVEYVLGETPRKWQRKALDRIAWRLVSGDKHLRIHVRCCHSAGKTWLAATLFLWWMLTRPQARAITTAPTQRGVDHLLWAEIRKLYNGSKFAGKLGQMMDSSEFRVDWSQGRAFGLGIASDHPFNLEGHHSPTAAAVIFDEAKKVSDETRNSLQGVLHAPTSMMVAISTPWVEDGWWYQMDRDGGDSVMRVVVTIDELIEDDIAGSEQARADYVAQFGGEDSPEFRSRAMAEYISQNPFGAINAAAVDAAMAREPTGVGVKVAALDVARGEDETNDESVIAIGHGVDVVSMVPFKSRDLVYLARRLAEAGKGWGVDIIRPDANGIGAGPTDIIVAEGWPIGQVDEFVAQTRANDPDRFENRAAESAWAFAQRINNGECSIPKDDELRRQCLQVRFVPRAGGRLGLEKSPRINGKKSRSPDRFDACVMATADAVHNKGTGLLGFLSAADFGKAVENVQAA